jgi:hypothetical protein
LGLTIIEVATGLFGLVFYKWMPRVITRIEGDAQVEEDVRSEQSDLREAIRELSETLGQASQQIIDGVKPMLPGLSRLYASGYAQEETLASISAAVGQNGEAEGTQIVEKLLRIRELDACLTLYRIRKTWLLSHIGITAILMTLSAFHVGAVFYFWGGMGG